MLSFTSVMYRNNRFMTTWIILLSLYIIVLDIKEIPLHSGFPFLVSYVKTALALKKENLGPGVRIFLLSFFLLLQAI